MHFAIKKNEGGKWHWNLYHEEQVIAMGPPPAYPSKDACVEAITLTRGCHEAEIVLVKISS